MSRFFSLRGKLLVLTCTLLIGFGLSVSIYLKAHYADKLSQELLKRGISIAHHLSTLSANAFIEKDSLYLDYLAKEHHKTEEDISYIFMLDPQGMVLAHSFESSYPIELTTVNPLSPDKTSSVVSVDTGDELVYDIAVPILDGKPGSIHLGISAKMVDDAVQTLITNLLTAMSMMGLITLGIAFIASRKISRPVTLLTQAVEALADGDRRQHNLPVETQDEIGQLTKAFNRMVEQLGQAEESLNYQKRFLEVLLDDIPTPIFYKDRQGYLLGCNRAYCDFWGHDKNSIVGSEASNLYLAEEAKIHAAKDVEVFNEGRSVRYELTVQDSNNKKHQVIFHKASFLDEKNLPAGIIGVMLDITKERQSEQSRREFVSTVAHEFQTPLAIIIGYADLLFENSLDNEATREALRTICDKTEWLSEMVDDLLDLARIEAGKVINIEPICGDIRPLLIETLNNFRAGHPLYQLQVTLPDTIPDICVDHTRLQQVIGNLLSNAMKYSTKETQICVSAVSDEKGLYIKITDQGIGMTVEQLSHLFEKFYRADTSNTASQGTGLGLYICKTIIDAHNGDIQIQSAPGQGTQVTVYLPIDASSK
jgi:PAS domain S-box-containing protein